MALFNLEKLARCEEIIYAGHQVDVLQDKNGRILWEGLETTSASGTTSLTCVDVRKDKAVSFTIKGISSQEAFSKNMCPDTVEYWENGHYAWATGIKETISPARIRLKDLLPCKPNTKYYVNVGVAGVNFVIRGFDSTGAIVQDFSGITTGSFTTGDSTALLGIALYGNTAITLDMLSESTCKLYIGTEVYSSSTYERYAETREIEGSKDCGIRVSGNDTFHETTISLTNWGLENGLTMGFVGSQDELIFYNDGSGKIIRNNSYILLDNCTALSESTNEVAITCPLPFATSENMNSLCNRLSSSPSANNGSYYSVTSAGVVLHIPKYYLKALTTAGAIEWLANNPTYVLIEQPTPTYEILTAEQVSQIVDINNLLLMYKPQTTYTLNQDYDIVVEYKTSKNRQPAEFGNGVATIPQIDYENGVATFDFEVQDGTAII